jgi:NADPH:quinone reductase-like Zn-dependent oxidoreductase
VAEEVIVETMKAVRIHEHGGPEVLRLESTPRPSPGKGEILVRVHAVGVNPADAWIRTGAIPTRLPRTAGLDFAGTVAEVGPGVDELAPGDEVFGRPRLSSEGSWAEYVIVKPGDVAKKPKRIDFAHAAALPTAGLAAWQALFAAGGEPTMGLASGQTVLIHGGAGGVGSFAIQLARWAGARVIATGRGENLEYLRELGADEAIDYTAQRFEDVVGEVDAVLDLVGGDTQQRSFRVLKEGGVLTSTVGVDAASEAEAERRGMRAIAVNAKNDREALGQLARLIDDGVLNVPVTEELPLERAREAQEHVQSGHGRGKIVLDVV